MDQRLGWRRALTFCGMILLLSACAEQPNPVAFDPIRPELDETGFMQSLVAENPHVMTLLDSVTKQGVPKRVASAALLKFDKFRSRVQRDEYIAMIDFTQHSGKKRMFLVNRRSGKVDALSVAHGEGSDPDGDGFAQYFSNIPNSRMSSLGAYLVAEKYVGKWGNSMRLDGLESTNSNARSRAIVLHPASYVEDGSDEQGLSWGCPAIPFAWIDRAITRLRDGGFLYVYGVNTYKPTSRDVFIQRMALLPDYQWTDESDTPGSFR